MEQAIKRKPNVHAFLYIYRNHAGKFWWCAVPYVDSQGRRRQRRRSFRGSPPPPAFSRFCGALSLFLRKKSVYYRERGA